VKESPLVSSTVAQQSNSSAKVTRDWKVEKQNAVMAEASLTVLGIWLFFSISLTKNMMNITADAMVGIKGGRIWN
jgi:hypothetical protein